MLNVWSRSSRAPGQHAHLAGDFAGGQVPHQPHLAREAERAGHRAADLRRDAEGHRRRVGNEDRLDLPAVGEREQEFLGAVGRTLARDDGRRRERELIARARRAVRATGRSSRRRR